MPVPIDPGLPAGTFEVWGIFRPAPDQPGYARALISGVEITPEVLKSFETELFEEAKTKYEMRGLVREEARFLPVTYFKGA